MQPTILTDVKPDNPAFRDEFFGPVAMFFRVKDEDSRDCARQRLRFRSGRFRLHQGLARGKRVASRVDTGMMFINNISWSDAELPFGGIKDSGYGRELGDMGIQEFVNKKLVRYVGPKRRSKAPALRSGDEAFITLIPRPRCPSKSPATGAPNVRQCRRVEGNPAARTARGFGALRRSQS